MSGKTPAQIWDVVKDWEAQNAGKLVTIAIPAERTDAPDVCPLVPDASYFRLLLCAVSLGNGRAWFTEWYPVVQSAVQLELGGERITLGHAARVPVAVNLPLSDPAPHGGGTLEVTAALLALKGSADPDGALEVLEGLTADVEAEPHAAARVAEQVATRMQDPRRPARDSRR